jgi:hypothetical protein
VLGLHDVEDRTDGLQPGRGAAHGGGARARHGDRGPADPRARPRGETPSTCSSTTRCRAARACSSSSRARWDGGAPRPRAGRWLPGACERSCIDCLQTYRNRFYHEHLDRHARPSCSSGGHRRSSSSTRSRRSCPKTQTTVGPAPDRGSRPLPQLLVERACPSRSASRRIDLGGGYGQTIPDFFYKGEDETSRGSASTSTGWRATSTATRSSRRRTRSCESRLREKARLRGDRGARRSSWTTRR